MNLAELGIILASRSLPLAVVSSGEQKAEFISPGGMPSRPGGSAVTTSCQRSQENNGDQSGAGLVPNRTHWLTSAHGEADWPLRRSRKETRGVYAFFTFGGTMASFAALATDRDTRHSPRVVA